MISEEIARQLENSGAKYILTIGLFYENIKAACEIYPGIQKIIVLGMDEKPEECLSFIEMMIYDDGSLYDQDRYFYSQRDIWNLLIWARFYCNCARRHVGSATNSIYFCFLFVKKSWGEDLNSSVPPRNSHVSVSCVTSRTTNKKTNLVLRDRGAETVKNN